MSYLTETDLSEENIDRLRVPTARVIDRVIDELYAACRDEGLDRNENDAQLVGLIIGANIVNATSENLGLDPERAFAAITDAGESGLFRLTEDEARDAGVLHNI